MLKYFCLLGLISATKFSNGQDFYITLNNDTVKCDVRKDFPHSVKVKVKDSGTKVFDPSEIKGYKRDDVYFESKKILNGGKGINALIFLPSDKVDRKYLYSDPILSMTSNGTTTFYEVTTFSMGGYGGGRNTDIDLFVENDTLGLKLIPRMQAVFGTKSKQDVLEVLGDYIKDNKELFQKLEADDSYKTFNYKGIKKIFSDYFGKSVVD